LEQQAPTVPALPGRPPARRDLAAGFGEGPRVSRLGLRSTSVYGRHGRPRWRASQRSVSIRAFRRGL
jgi:hypothetical protein